MFKRTMQLMAAAAALSACGAAPTTSSSPAAGSSPSSGSSSSTAASGDVNVGTTSLGKVLVDKNGHTLYYFTPEQGSQLVCGTGSCVATWPLLTASGSPSAGQGVSGQLTVIATADGKSEIAFNGWPLHTYAQDAQAGDTKGQGIGGKWFAATPSLSSTGPGSSSSPPASATPTYSPY